MALDKVTMAFGVTGDESDIRNIIKKEVESHVDEIFCDSLGSLIAIKKGNKKFPKVMLAAHMDEVGVIITGVNKDGTLSFEPSGGIDKKVLASKIVYIGQQKLPGIVILGDDYEDSFIDIGTDFNKAKELVKVGEYAVFSTEYGEFGNGSIKSKALDDRMGCQVLIDILKNSYDIPIYGAFTVQEEIGDRGAFTSSYNVMPDIGIVLEGTVCADLPTVEGYRHSTTLGKGPAISIADKTSYFDVDLSTRLCKIAQENNITHQRRRITGGGNDGGAIHLAGRGSRCVTISVPCRYIHSPVSVASYSDYINTVKLVDMFLKDIQKGEQNVD